MTGTPEQTSAPDAAFSGSTDQAPTPIATSQPRQVEIPAEIPPVDISKHSVPLEEIYFDTFRRVNRAVPLSIARPELIRELLDAIPPIHNPIYEPGKSADWLRPEDRVLGYAAAEGAWAYPLRILNFHEIVNDDLAGEPVLISYCPLCFSGVVYSRKLGDQVLTFGNTSALYESDMVMLDYQTGSYWWQVAGKAIVGPLTDEALEVLPSQTTTWRSWLELHPETLVLSRDTGFTREYGRDPFLGIQESINRGRFAFPVSQAGRDERLLPGEVVVAVRIGNTSRAYPLASSFSRVIHDELEGRPIVVLISAAGPDAGVYDPVVVGERLTFEWSGERFQDQQTGSSWDLSGLAIDGELQGTQLDPVPSKTSFWFAIVAAEPGISVHQE